MADYSLNDQGFYQDAQGDLAPGQTTPGMADNPEAAIQYDADKDLYYHIVGGVKQYQSPMSYAGHEGVGAAGKGTGHGMPDTMDKGGGAFHGTPTWNASEGHFDVKLDMGKLLSYVAAGTITAGAISAALGPASTGGLLPSTTTAGSSVLGAPSIIPAGSVAMGGDVPGALAAASSGGGGVTSALTSKRIHDLLGSSADALGHMGQASEDNRQYKNLADLQYNNSNITGENQYQLQLDARSRLEAGERTNAQQDVARADFAASRGSRPGYSRPLGATMMGSLSELEKQALARLQTAPQYSTNAMPALKPYQPIHPDTSPGAIEQIANYGVPAIKVGTSIWDWVKGIV